MVALRQDRARDREVSIDVRARATGLLRSEIDLSWSDDANAAEVFHLATDECPRLGGEGSAPSPLAYFAAALLGSLMSHVRTFARSMDIRVNDLSMTATFRWNFRQTGEAVHESSPDSISVDIDIDSDAREGDLLRLVDLARQGCFIEQTLRQGITVSHRLKRPGGWTSL